MISVKNLKKEFLKPYELVEKQCNELKGYD